MNTPEGQALENARQCLAHSLLFMRDGEITMAEDHLKFALNILKLLSVPADLREPAIKAGLTSLRVAVRLNQVKIMVN